MGRMTAIAYALPPAEALRKTHTDDLDLAIATQDLQEAYRRVRLRAAGPGWSLPRPLSRAHEENDVFEVCHLTYRGSVVDLQ